MKTEKAFFHMNFGVWKTVMIAVVLAGALAVIGLDIAILVGAVVTSVPAVAWASLAAAVLVIAATLILLCASGYRFDDDHITVSMGFFKDKLAYENITQLKRNGDSGTYYLIFGDIETGTNVRVDVSAAKNDAFVQELRKHLPTVPVETFVLPDKEKK